MAQGQVDPEIRSMLTEQVSERVITMCLTAELRPGKARIQKWVEKSIDSWVEGCFEDRLGVIMDGYDEDEMPDQVEMELDARLDVMGNYYEESRSYGYEIELEAVNLIIAEMESVGIHKDDDYDPNGSEDFDDDDLKRFAIVRQGKKFVLANPLKANF